MEHSRGEKRKRSDQETSHSQSNFSSTRDPSHRDVPFSRGPKPWSTSEQARLNKLQEDERHREFMAKEREFMLLQKRKAGEIRVKEGRAKAIDWLVVNLRIVDPVEDLINEDTDEDELDYIDPEGVIDGLSSDQLSDLRRDIGEFLDLERNPNNKDYWRTMKIICKERQRGVEGRAVRPVSSDIDNLLRPKSFDELEKLEKQINKKLDSDEPIDTDYWQQLLESLLVYRAKAKLKKIYQSVLNDKLETLKAESEAAAKVLKSKLATSDLTPPKYSKHLDPDPLLQIDAKDKLLSSLDESRFLGDIALQRQKIMKLGYVPAPKEASRQSDSQFNDSPANAVTSDAKNSTSLFDREVAKGVEEDEEVFAGEEQVETKNAHLWKGKYRPRKPRYFNRVQMGYEWNKYNQTHYDHDNPPPKVVQGYKFHVFYPDLIDPTRAPTYKIIREGGRKKGQTVAPAGEEDTCIIRFMSGPPYEDIAFRIVDRDWDYSAKHDRGFKSTFENGILTLHFSFKKVYYRK